MEWINTVKEYLVNNGWKYIDPPDYMEGRSDHSPAFEKGSFRFTYGAGRAHSDKVILCIIYVDKVPANIDENTDLTNCVKFIEEVPKTIEALENELIKHGMD